MQGKDLSSHELRYALVHLLARLADCPHNKQVMVEQEHEVLPAVLPLMIFPQHVGGFKVDTPKISLLHLCCTSIAPLLHHCCNRGTSVAPLLHLCCTSVAPLVTPKIS